ncbi:NUDIX domain-containing protein [Streptomyces sp. NPDC006476]|uniref:NUDIX domain-containing protein n=1 Tax=Streptomyces sp. NPDC006476 TaxID=3157175 RepID=UPI0033A35375
MTLEPGDHVWYWNGNISQELSIPQALWFPGFKGPTDYLGHGREIFKLVFDHDADLPPGTHVPAGSVAPEEPLEEAVLREVAEECGLTCVRVLRPLAQEHTPHPIRRFPPPHHLLRSGGGRRRRCPGCVGPPRDGRGARQRHDVPLPFRAAAPGLPVGGRPGRLAGSSGSISAVAWSPPQLARQAIDFDDLSQRLEQGCARPFP